MRLKRMKKAIALAFFHGGCNQSQIFPRSGGKITNLFIIPEGKRYLFVLTALTGSTAPGDFCRAFLVGVFRGGLFAEGFGAAGDFEYFLGDGGLAGLVVLQRQFCQQVGSVVGGLVHGRHPGSLFRRP